MPDDGPLLEIDELRTWYPAAGRWWGGSGGWVKAVDGISLTIRRGETFGLVGESGCGKSTLGRTLLRLEKARSGRVLFEGEDLLRMGASQLRATRRHIGAIFQDPMSSLDPRMTVRQLVAEGLVVAGVGRAERDARVEALMGTVGLRPEILSRFPHEFSGGQRQRIGIARALALRPRFVIADEPVSALDVSIQSQVLNLLRDLQAEFGLTYLFIAHDLSVIEYLSDRVGVMYLGRLMEVAPAEVLYDDPRTPYTRALLSAIPGSANRPRTERIVLQGDLPSPLDPPSGCPFRTRCWLAEPRCAAERPELREIAPAHFAACHFADDPEHLARATPDRTDPVRPVGDASPR